MQNHKLRPAPIYNKKETEVNLIKSTLLFFIAAFLLITTAPIGILFAIVRQFVISKVIIINIYLLEVALVLDQAGNVIMQHFLNFALLKKKKRAYLFGNKNETISSVIGKNSLTGTLNSVGLMTDAFLNFIDNRHSLDSIIYDLKIIAAKEAV
jgi:8-oxo-dGTP diphosphatase